jgi:hypothetical protein
VDADRPAALRVGGFRAVGRPQAASSNPGLTWAAARRAACAASETVTYTPISGHVRDHGIRPPRIGMLGSLRVLREVRSNHVLVSMIVLGGLGSFVVGTSLPTVMPLFAHDLGAASAGTAYGILLVANGAGGVIGGCGPRRPTAAGSSACAACPPTGCGPGAASPSASSAPPSASTGHSPQLRGPLPGH